MINFVKTFLQVAIFGLAFTFPALDAKSFNGIKNGVDPVITVDYQSDFFCAPCAGTPNPGATTRNPAIGWSEGKDIFTFGLTNATAGDGVTYEWQVSFDGTAFTSLANSNKPTYQIPVPQRSWYRCVVTCTASGKSTTSTPVMVNYSPPGERTRH